MQLRQWIFIGIIVIAAGYFFYEASGVLFAPKLVIFEPKDGEVLNSTRMEIAGVTLPATAVWAGGKIFTSNEKGIFQGVVPLTPGYNEIGVWIKDRFGSETRKILKVFVK